MDRQNYIFVIVFFLILLMCFNIFINKNNEGAGSVDPSANPIYDLKQPIQDIKKQFLHSFR